RSRSDLKAVPISAAALMARNAQPCVSGSLLSRKNSKCLIIAKMSPAGPRRVGVHCRINRAGKFNPEPSCHAPRIQRTESELSILLTDLFMTLFRQGEHKISLGQAANRDPCNGLFGLSIDHGDAVSNALAHVAETAIR